MAKIVFYCNDTKHNIDAFEYYKQDIDAFRRLGHDVIICTRYIEIPFQFDLMFVWWWTYALFPVLFSRLLGRPVIVTGTFNFRFPPELGDGDYFSRPFWQRVLIKIPTILATRNFFVNMSEFEGCSSYFRLNNSRYLPHVIADDYLIGPSTDRELSIFNLAWSGKKNLIRKGVPDLVKAISLLRDEFPNIKLNLAGHEGDGAGYLSELIKSFGLENNVNCLGALSRERKISLLRASEIYAQPSHFEGFGLAIAESMGSGACVVTCDVGAVKSVVGDCGIYVPPGSPEELAKALRTVLLNEGVRKHYQKCAHERAISNFSMQSKIDRLRKYLSELGITSEGEASE